MRFVVPRPPEVFVRPLMDEERTKLSTNLKISDHAPGEYWPQQLVEKGVSDERLRNQMGWHALPEDWTNLSYDDFLTRRRHLLAHITREGFRRLADASYVPDLTAPKPDARSTMTAATLEDLVTSGALPAGSRVEGSDPDRPAAGEITQDGALQVGEHVYESPTVAAREAGFDVADGWTFWLVRLNGNEPIPLAEIRAGTEAERG